MSKSDSNGADKVEKLRHSLTELFIGKEFSGIDLKFENRRIEKGVGFFPYGNGFISESASDIPIGGILVLGKDFGTTGYFEKVRKFGEGEKHTISNLKKVLCPEYEDRIFCTNVFMGLRKAQDDSDQKQSNLLEFPQRFNVDYLMLCKEFLSSTLSMMRPTNIITLGQFPNDFIEMNFPDEKNNVVSIPHPSMWHFNWKEADLGEKINYIKERLPSNAHSIQALQ